MDKKEKLIDVSTPEKLLHQIFGMADYLHEHWGGEEDEIYDEIESNGVALIKEFLKQRNS